MLFVCRVKQTSFEKSLGSEVLGAERLVDRTRTVDHPFPRPAGSSRPAAGRAASFFIVISEAMQQSLWAR